MPTSTLMTPEFMVLSQSASRLHTHVSTRHPNLDILQKLEKLKLEILGENSELLLTCSSCFLQLGKWPLHPPSFSWLMPAFLSPLHSVHHEALSVLITESC